MNIIKKEKVFIREMYGLIDEQEVQNRIINLYQIGNKEQLIKYKSQGFTPYYFDSKVNGDYKMVEINKNNFSKIEKIGRVFLLSHNELEKVNELIFNINNITKLYLEKIETQKQLIVAVLVEKIMK